MEKMDLFRKCLEDGDTSEARRLLARNPSLVSAQGYNALHCVCELYRHFDAVDFIKEILAAGGDANCTDRNGKSPLHYICSGALGYADCEELEAIKILCEAGANVNTVDDFGRTPLWDSSCFIRPICLEDVPEEYDEADPICELLLKLGADPNLADNDGVGPLHIAVVHNDISMVKSLLEHGADPLQPTRGCDGLYNKRLILLDNHSGCEVPVGSTPISLCSSPEMAEVLHTIRKKQPDTQLALFDESF